MKFRQRASKFMAAIATAGLLAFGPPSPGDSPRVDECCYQVPSGSMKPTLFPRDKFGLAKYAAGAGPRAGDVVALKLPKTSSPIYVKRIIGLPGDRVQMSHGTLLLNDQPAKRDRVGDFVDEDEKPPTRFRRWRETLPNGASYETIDQKDDYFVANTPAFSVPSGQYFVIGDNRENSLDSRSPGNFGDVPADLIMGRVVVQ